LRFFGFILIDIIIYRDIFRDKLLVITLYPGFVWVMFPMKTISVVCLNIDSYSMRMVAKSINMYGYQPVLCHYK